ncbi:hypothetical protein KGF86_05060 [Ornithinibacillus massiliensis]|uniref:Uncharacterized protein n=1 Tax=Ornithinibacillus massiliensis TaxID=1944633 RepID=A0ABS5MB72_9BACI|nr:hypothetical protein [Ornithinibacillus massiliensis]MBS3679576.1 hypothetical protein [Ornithinibacillus massiliensis]
MRVFMILTVFVAMISVVYKWRYKIMNAMLAVSFLRKIAVSISMNLPSIRKNILPRFFKEPTDSTM